MSSPTSRTSYSPHFIPKYISNENEMYSHIWNEVAATIPAALNSLAILREIFCSYIASAVALLSRPTWDFAYSRKSSTRRSFISLNKKALLPLNLFTKSPKVFVAEFIPFEIRYSSALKASKVSSSVQLLNNAYFDDNWESSRTSNFDL